MVLGDIRHLHGGDVYRSAAFCLSGTKILKLTTIGGAALNKQNLHVHSMQIYGEEGW